MSEYTYLHSTYPNAPHTYLQDVGKKATGAPLHPGAPLCHVSYWLLPSGVGHEAEMKNLPSGVSSPSVCSFLSKQEMPPKMKERHKPTPQEIASYAGGSPFR